MTDKMENQYNPDYVSPPGDTLLEILEELRISRPVLAKLVGFPLFMVNEIIEGKAAITPEIARRLERALGKPTAEFWLNRERLYRQQENPQAGQVSG